MDRIHLILMLMSLVLVFVYIQQEYTLATYITELKFPFAL
jgi:hypothetical protein